MHIRSNESYASSFKGSRRYPMHRCSPTAPAVARLARRWAERRPNNIAEAQEELTKAASMEIEYMKGSSMAATRGLSAPRAQYVVPRARFRSTPSRGAPRLSPPQPRKPCACVAR